MRSTEPDDDGYGWAGILACLAVPFVILLVILGFHLARLPY